MTPADKTTISSDSNPQEAASLPAVDSHQTQPPAVDSPPETDQQNKRKREWTDAEYRAALQIRRKPSRREMEIVIEGYFDFDKWCSKRVLRNQFDITHWLGLEMKRYDAEDLEVLKEMYKREYRERFTKSTI
jgi:hypothetical protein